MNRVNFDRYRLHGTWAIYIPTWQCAQRMIDVVDESSSLSSLDTFLFRKRMIPNLYFPSVFDHDDRGESHVHNSSGEHPTRLFIRDYMKTKPLAVRGDTR